MAPSNAGTGSGLDLLPWPDVDFGTFGPIETTKLPRIRRLAAANLERNWVRIPHVTQHDHADVTILEEGREKLKGEVPGAERLTLLAFVLKSTARALQDHPELNASLRGNELILKHYYNIGVLVETDRGLVVPVIRDIDELDVIEIGQQLTRLADRAREGAIGPEEMEGRTCTVSSIGHIGGTAFTPIINAPDVAILGLTRAEIRPMWIDGAWQPRLMLPLSLSYDHRAVDGAVAARFTRTLADLLGDRDQQWIKS